MYQGTKYKYSKKSMALLVSLLLIVSVAAVGIIAFLTDTDNKVENTFQMSKVSTSIEENLEEQSKKDVSIKNTGDITAYIRAAVIVTWQDDAGNVYAEMPVEGRDYTIDFNVDENWEKGSDGFWYWKSPVKSVEEDEENCYTGVLINECTPVSGKAPENYYLNVEIIGSAIQADGTDENGERPVVLAWGTAGGGSVTGVTGNVLIIEAEEGGTK